MGQEEEIDNSKPWNCRNCGLGIKNNIDFCINYLFFTYTEGRLHRMKTFRKIVSLMLALILVLSMSTFVFAAECEVQPRSCSHNVIHKQVTRFDYVDQYYCDMYYDFYEMCSECGTIFYQSSSFAKRCRHFVEDGDSYCWQCHHYGCS